VDAAISALAAAQHGVVARRQLLALGVGRNHIRRRVETSRLHRLHRGVYAVGHPVLSRHGRWMAAVLAGGPGAVLSHRSAAALWGIHDGAGESIDLIAPNGSRQESGARVRRATLAPDEVTSTHGVPTTTPARTLLDLAAVLNPRRLAHALHEAEIGRLASPASLDELLWRHRTSEGTRTLRRILERERAGSTVTKSELERRFLSFLNAVGLAPPATNQGLKLDGLWFEPDCMWPTQRLIAELDGYEVHATRRAFERDRRRARALEAAGWHVIHVTWRQLHEDQAALARDLHRMLRL